MSSENKFKNEMIIKIGAEEILLRPTFENIANLESKLGGVQYLAFKFSQGLGGKAGIMQAKSLPTLTECAQIIYFCQAMNNPDNPQEKQYSLEEIFQKLTGNLRNIPAEMMLFMGRMMAGNRNAPDFSENTKKKSSKQSQVKTL